VKLKVFCYFNYKHPPPHILTTDLFTYTQRMGEHSHISYPGLPEPPSHQLCSSLTPVHPHSLYHWIYWWL